MKVLINFFAYFCGWWIAILGGNALALLALFVVFLSHFALWRDVRDIFVILFFIFAGFAVEWGFMVSGALDYHSNLPPAWVICMWAMLATTVRHSLSFLMGRPWRAAAVALVLAPLVYANSVRFGPADWGRPAAQGMLILCAAWVPLAALISGWLVPAVNRLEGGEEDTQAFSPR